MQLRAFPRPVLHKQTGDENETEAQREKDRQGSGTHRMRESALRRADHCRGYAPDDAEKATQIGTLFSVKYIIPQTIQCNATRLRVYASVSHVVEHRFPEPSCSGLIEAP